MASSPLKGLAVNRSAVAIMVPMEGDVSSWAACRSLLKLTPGGGSGGDSLLAMARKQAACHFMEAAKSSTESVYVSKCAWVMWAYSRD